MSNIHDILDGNYGDDSYQNNENNQTEPQTETPTNFAHTVTEIHYISELKKILVGRNNNTISQKFKIDNRIQDLYDFQVVNKNNQIVNLSGFNYEFYGSYIDARQNEHILFYSDTFTISENNILTFKVNTYTSEYVNYVKTPKVIDIAIRKRADEINQVILRDTGLAYPTPVYEGEEPSPVVAGFGLSKNGYVMSLTGTVLSGDNSTIAITDNVISYIGPSGNTYTAGTGIGISDQNVISLTATIPSAISDLTNDSQFATSIQVSSIIESYNYLSSVSVEYNDSFGDPQTGSITGITLADSFINGSIQNNKLHLEWAGIKCDYAGGAGYYTEIDSNTLEFDSDSEYLHINIPDSYTEEVSGAAVEAATGWIEQQGYITGYNAGSGISIENGTINCTVQGGGGATYTAGSGISISDQNVISLTATIPSAVSQLTNDEGYITGITVSYLDGEWNSYTVSATGIDFGQGFVEVSDYGDNIAHVQWKGLRIWDDSMGDSLRVKQIDFSPTDFNISFSEDYVDVSLAHPIPLSTSQLTNDTGFITGYTAGSGISIDNGVINCTVQGGGGSGTVTVDKLQNIVVDGTVQDSSFVMQYIPSADIVQNVIALDDGLLTLNPISGFENDIAVGKAATFENWIYPSGELTGVAFDENLTFIGELPSSFTSGFTQVFTRRIIRKTSNITIQQISYNYEFEDTFAVIDMDPINPISWDFENASTSAQNLGNYFTYDGSSTLNYSIVETLPVGVSFNNGILSADRSLMTGDVDTVLTLNVSASDVPTVATTTFDFEVTNVIEPVPPQPEPSSVPLTFKAVNGPAEISLVANGDPDPITIQYNKNNTMWQTFMVGPNGDTISLDEGEEVAFSASTHTFSQWNNGSNTYSFRIENGYAQVYGNLQSLVAFDSAVNGHNQYQYLFDNRNDQCHLVGASGLLLANQATNLGAYINMFQNCSYLTSTPVLPLTGDIGGWSYDETFQGCTSITDAVISGATSVGQDALYRTFDGCSSLTSITVTLTSWNNVNSNWVNNVAANGTFYKPSALSNHPTCIPNGWTVVNID